MKNLIVTFVVAMSFVQVRAQTQIPEEILSEGRMLYRLEWISRYGKNTFYDLFGDEGMRKSGSGQISYLNEKGRFVNFYYDYCEGKTRDDDVTYRIMLRMLFDNPFDRQQDKIISPTIVDTCNMVPTPEELSLIEMRDDVYKRLSGGVNYIFQPYDNTVYKWFPVISNGKRSVFVIPKLMQSDILTFGGDYRLTYDNSDRLVEWCELHDARVDAELPDLSMNPVDRIRSLVRSLGPSWSISPTDVFTLLEYADSSEYKRRYEMGENVFYPEYDIETEESVIMVIKEFLNQRD